MTFFDRWIAGEALKIDETLRSAMPERFVHLSDGYTHFERQGPAAGEPILLIHGFSVPNFIWDPTFAALVENGFHVIRYDMFGRGLSDRPHTAYDMPLFRQQLWELIQALNLKGKINLLSLSMGGVITADFASRYPEQIARLAFIDPAGFALDLPWQINLLRWPLVGELLLGALGRFGQQSLLEAMLSDFYHPTQAAKDYFIPRYQKQMQYQGFKRALLSTLRNGLLDEDLTLFSTLNEMDISIQLIWGEHDPTVPYPHHQTFQQLISRTQFHSIAEAGHIPHFERPEIVNPLLIDFFSR